MAAKPARKSMEGSRQQQEVSGPPESVYQAQAPLPPSGVIYEGNLAIFKARISGEPVWVINNNENPGVLGNISGEEEKEPSQDQPQQVEGASPESGLKLFINQFERVETDTKLFINQIERVETNTTVGNVDKRKVKKEEIGKKAKKAKKAKKEKKKGGERDFQCDQCDYKATQKISLTRHLQVHAGKTFVCEEADCGKSYKWEVDLRRHKERTHSNLTFPCPDADCDYLGRSQRNLAVHKRSQHSGPRPDLVCQICGDQFSARQYLEVHIKSKHLGHREVCSVCGEDFATKAILQRHVKEKHIEGEFKCDFCDKTFTRKSSKESHVKKAHQNVIEIQK